MSSHIEVKKHDDMILRGFHFFGIHVDYKGAVSLLDHLRTTEELCEIVLEAVDASVYKKKWSAKLVQVFFVIYRLTAIEFFFISKR